MASVAQPQRTPLESLIRVFGRLDGWLILSSTLLTIIGMLSLHSIDAATAGSTPTDFLKKQMVRLGIGVAPFAIFLLVRPEFWKRHARTLYWLNVILLALVLRFGDTRGGAQRWLEFGFIDFQPSELAKILVVLTLATFYVSRIEDVRKLRTFALSFLHVAIPMALIYKQPHLGSTLVVGVTWLAISWIAGVRIRFVLGAIGVGLSLLVAAYFVPGAMGDYQKERISALFHPDKQGSGYQVERGLVAIGSGQVGGKGYLRGEQKNLKFIPEQQTDFIFTVIGEEGGLVGGFIVLALFGVLFARIWLIVHLGMDPFHRMVAAGILAILAFHMTANLGMVLRLLPVVGLWLPFMSFGGTALWLCMACVGLLLNVRSQEDQPDF